MSTTQLTLTYTFFRRWRYVALSTLLAFVLYYVLGYAFRPEAFSFEGVGAADLLLLVVIDQFLIECLTTFVLFRLLIGYAHVFKLQTVALTPRSIVRYEAAFVPLVFGAFFLTNPIAQSVRFLYREWGAYSAAVYFDTYFYSVPLYLTYLGLFIPLVYLALNINLLLEYSAAEKQAPDPAPLPTSPPETPMYVERIVGERGGYQKPLLLPEVLWFEVEARYYFAVTHQGRYRITQTLGALEKTLDPAAFIRVNRAAIVNVDAIESFSPWINGKYMAVMKDDNHTEFTISRKRVPAFKAVLGKA